MHKGSSGTYFEKPPFTRMEMPTLSVPDFWRRGRKMSFDDREMLKLARFLETIREKHRPTTDQPNYGINHVRMKKAHIYNTDMDLDFGVTILRFNRPR